jgi:nitrogenase molybdenum-iron protein alpha/beta subunit
MSSQKEINVNKIKEQLLKGYPSKVARKRSQQIIVNEKDDAMNVPEIKANTRTTPCVITQRGCTYAGCKGVSQSAGHHIANNQLFKHVIGRGKKPSNAKFRINLLGEYNIGGDAFIIEELLDRCGIHLGATFSRNSTYEGFENAHHADLNCVMCHRSIN